MDFGTVYPWCINIYKNEITLAETGNKSWARSVSHDADEWRGSVLVYTQLRCLFSGISAMVPRSLGRLKTSDLKPGTSVEGRSNVYKTSRVYKVPAKGNVNSYRYINPTKGNICNIKCFSQDVQTLSD